VGNFLGNLAGFIIVIIIGVVSFFSLSIVTIRYVIIAYGVWMFIVCLDLLIKLYEKVSLASLLTSM
jgi:hypothetical protein